LRSGGVLPRWLPIMGGPIQVVVTSVKRSLYSSFPYVRAFFHLAGIHCLCSDRPIQAGQPKSWVLRMPAAALFDFT